MTKAQYDINLPAQFSVTIEGLGFRLIVSNQLRCPTSGNRSRNPRFQPWCLLEAYQKLFFEQLKQEPHRENVGFAWINYNTY